MRTLGPLVHMFGSSIDRNIVQSPFLRMSDGSGMRELQVMMAPR